jgi:hypothetical protein
MQADGLSSKERAALFALLAEARELSNLELEERVGFRLDGKERRKLNDLKLVDSRKPGRAYVHELSEGGWRWCADELFAGPQAGARNMERALYAVLAGLGRYLQGTGQSLADIFSLRADERAGEEVDVEARVVVGYRVLASEPGEFVQLSRLLGELTDVPRADVDAALGQMYQAQRVNLVPQANQLALSAADRESALRIGGEDKHLISIEQL